MATDYLENKVIDLLYRAVAWTIPETIYACLGTDDPTDAGSWAYELAGNGYARVAIIRSTTAFIAGIAAGDATRTSNGVEIAFPTPTGDWGLVDWWMLGEDSTPGAGNMWNKGQIPSPRNINAGDNPPSFAVGTLNLDAL